MSNIVVRGWCLIIFLVQKLPEMNFMKKTDVEI